jgi:TolA-binding protein
MKSSVVSRLFLLVAATTTTVAVDAFTLGQRLSATSSTTTSRTTLLLSSTQQQQSRPDLVDQSLFIAAVERIEDEIAMAMEQQQMQDQEQQDQQEGTAGPSQPSEEEPQGDAVYAIGRIFVDLPVDRQPELDLTESIGPLVLVTGVWGRTAEVSGLQPFDTITRVTVGSSAAELTGSGEDRTDGTIRTADSLTPSTTFAASCKQRTLEETAAVLTAAAQHAVSQGRTDIQLEVNRLILGYYAQPKP